MKHFVYGLQSEFRLSDYDIDKDEYKNYYRHKIYAISLSNKNLINLEGKPLVESDQFFKQWNYIPMEIYIRDSEGNMTPYYGRIKTKTHKLIALKLDDRQEALLYVKSDDNIVQDNIEFDIFYVKGI